jgi:hypothetical protein
MIDKKFQLKKNNRKKITIIKIKVDIKIKLN